ncbi:MAG TPA: hypothetical protein VEK15_13545, partial [Vicinamibacteria bacterium]|nr:hypothetical protein [Vicinamibacteria bacterium]
FRWRGDMIWDNYLGPKRFCASLWGDDEWEQALLYMARHRMNFLEFYPPLERVFARAFPEIADDFEEGTVWKSEAKHALAKRVVARGRALGIHFMYVLSYGAFPEPVRALFPDLEWRNGFLCAHQPELMELTEKVWRVLIEELGTDHWYAVRHRGEEEQVYSDPCRSVTKSEGFQQAFVILGKVDPRAAITVWTWGERIPDLFQGFPSNVRAAHIRHGMADVFGDRGAGREQSDGRPGLVEDTLWLSGQFTVFGGNETGLQTAWCDAKALTRDATASSQSSAEGYFQWPEWSNTSAWLAHVVAKLAWRPKEPSVAHYAERRHGERAGTFLAAFGPLVRDGNAKFMHPPRKRLLVPYFNAPESLELLESVRAGARAMLEVLEGAPSMFRRDFLDIVAWVGLRQAQVLECDAYLRHVEGEDVSFDHAETTWRTLAAAMASSPDLSIVASTRDLARMGPISSRLEDSIWNLACDFYNGYPLVLSPEAIELVYLPQLEALRKATAAGGPVVLEAPGWFWHDFPDLAWADCVRKLPGEDAAAFEREMRARLGADPPTMREAPELETFLTLPLPEPRSDPPTLPRTPVR